MLDVNKAIPEEKVGRICMHCLGEFDNIKPIKISGMGYGSIFDMTRTQIDLCDECKSANPEWWEMKLVTVDKDADGTPYCIPETTYEFENEIYHYMLECPNAGKELFLNRYDDDEYKMEPQDWISYELGILPHDMCKAYRRFSPEEIEAYKTRFPVCDKVSIHVWPDGSKGAKCPQGAHGTSNGSCSGNIYSVCYKCKKFSVRKSEQAIPSINVRENFISEEIIKTKKELEELKIYLSKLESGDIDNEYIYSKIIPTVRIGHIIEKQEEQKKNKNK